MYGFARGHLTITCELSRDGLTPEEMWRLGGRSVARWVDPPGLRHRVRMMGPPGPASLCRVSRRVSRRISETRRIEGSSPLRQRLDALTVQHPSIRRIPPILQILEGAAAESTCCCWHLVLTSGTAPGSHPGSRHSDTWLRCTAPARPDRALRHALRSDTERDRSARDGAADGLAMATGGDWWLVAAWWWRLRACCRPCRPAAGGGLP